MVAEALVEYNEEAYAILYSNIACPELQRKLRDKHDEQGHDAWLCIEKPYSLEDNDTRLSIIVPSSPQAAPGLHRRR